jgi:penicillin-binding protein 1A
VKAWVGSRDFKHDQYDHVAQAARQPGSTFKPFVYGAALEGGIRPQRSYLDQAVEIRSVDGSVWKPTDMSAPSGMPVTLRDGLVHSRNIITAQVMQEVGVDRVVTLAKAAGVNQSRLDPVPSLALGTSPVTLLEMVNAYATIAHEGVRREPFVVKRIRDREGRVIAEFGSSPRRAMSPDTAVTLVDMMRAVVTQGTGTMVRTRFGIVADVAGKTGTTQNNTDGWFILMHPRLVAGAWVGFNDSRVTMRSDYWGQGGHNAILLVGDFFRDALREGGVDARARFASPQSAQAVMASWPAVGEREGASIARLEVQPDAQHAENAAPPEEAPPKSSQELDQLLQTLSRRDGWSSGAAATGAGISTSPLQ